MGSGPPERHRTEFGPEQFQQLIDFVHAKRGFTLFQIPNEAQPDSGFSRGLHLRQSELLSFLLHKFPQCHIFAILFPA